MRKRKGRISSALIPLRVLATTASGLFSTWNAYVKPRPWTWTVTKTEPSKEELSRLNLTGPRSYCDRCHVAHARFVVTLSSGRELHFCGHHYNKHKFELATCVITELPDES